MAAATGHSASHQATDRQAALRRVAIVLSSLPAPMAAKLLGSVDPQTKQSLRLTMSTLTDVDPLERRRAIEAFKVSVTQPAGVAPGYPPNSGYPQNLGDPRYAGVQATAYGGPPNAPGHSFAAGIDGSVASQSIIKEADIGDTQPQSPLSFLGGVGDEQLAGLLTREHPQAIALVMASIPAAKAGAVLPLLPENVRSETLSRIGRLEEIPHTAAEDMAAHFRTQLEESHQRPPTQPGQKKLDAILATMAAGMTEHSKPAPVQQQPIPAASLAARAQAVDPWQPPTTLSDADASAADLGQRLRLVHADPEPQVPAEPVEIAAPDSASLEPSAPQLVSTDQINNHLINLSPAELCVALGKGDTEDAVLTLCGLPYEVAEAAIAQLPKESGRMIRTEMANLSQLNLRQIDEAKERVAQRSLQTTDAQTPMAA